MSRSATRWTWRAVGVLGGHLIALFVVLTLIPPTPAAERIARWMEAGDRAAMNGQFALAQEHYARLLKLGPKGAIVAYERLASASLVAENYDLARVYLYAAASADGWTANRREQLRFILDHGTPSGLSSALLYAALDRYQADPFLLSQIAHQQIDHHAWDELEKTLDQWLALEPENGNALYWMGQLLAPVDPVKAREILAQVSSDDTWGERAAIVRQSLEGYGTLPLTEAHTRLGVALVGLYEWAFAERALQLAVEVNALNPTALAYLGLARDQQGRDGLPSIQAALSLSPNDPVLHYIAGLHWRRAGDDKAAFDSFSQAYWLDPANPALAAEAAISLERVGRLDEAVGWYRQAVTLAPTDSRWASLLAAFYADNGYDLEGDGLRYIEEIAGKATEDADLQISLGWAYYQVGRYDRAREVLSAALARDPSSGRGWYYWGVLLARSGDIQAARTAYEAAVSRPDSEFAVLASRALERLGDASP